MNLTVYKNKHYHWPVTKEDLEYFYCHEKLSGEKIAKMFAITSGTVSHWKKEYNIRTLEAWERRDVPSQLSEIEKEVILGYVLGDGYIGFNSKHAHLRVSQSSKQIDFVNQLYSHLKKWATYEPIQDCKEDKRFSKKYFTHRFDTIAHPVFDELQKLCYKNSIKTVNEKWLDFIGPLGLAMWYQSDGSLNNSKVSSTLNTNSFSLPEQHMIVDWLKKTFDIDSYVYKSGKYYKINIYSEKTFRRLIENHIINFFSYKLPNERKREANIRRKILP